MDSTAFLLHEWSKWAWQDRGLRLRFPRTSACAKKSSTTRPQSPLISDLVALEIDLAVARVCKANREAGGALVRYSLLREPYHRIVSKMDLARERVPGLIRLAEYGVSEVLDAD